MHRALSLCLSLSTLLVPCLAQEKTTKARTPKRAPKPAAVEPVKPAEPVAPPPAPAPKPKPRVRFETSYGAVVVELEPELAPKTVENFLAYVREGHYAGTIFHRVIPGFMVQAGGFKEDMSEKPVRAGIPNEADLALKGGLKNTRGTLAMARTEDPHSATAQFYFNTADNPSLDHRAPTANAYGYCPFGRVVEGMEALEKIEKVRTVLRRGHENVPEYAVRLRSVEVLPDKG